jgi:hypothetical protein
MFNLYTITLAYLDILGSHVWSHNWNHITLKHGNFLLKGSLLRPTLLNRPRL